MDQHEKCDNAKRELTYAFQINFYSFPFKNSS